MIDNEELGLAEPQSNDIIPIGWITRLLYVYIMVFVPFMSFSIAITEEPFGEGWQSGPMEYAAIMLGGHITPCFALFILWPIVSMALLLYDANHYANYFWVRWGIYSGVIIGLQYTLLLSIVIFGIPIIVGFVTYPIVIGVAYLMDIFNIWQKFTIISVIALLGIWGVSNQNVIFLNVLVGGFFISLFSGPIWFTCLTLTISRRLYSRYEQESLDLLQNISTIWLTSYALAWFVAVKATLSIYSHLPKTPPSQACYIATAAAQGHPKLVGSWPVALGEGRVMWVNPQLQYLKAGELMLLATWPRGHQQVRRVYDVIGPKIARRLHHPILADMAYLTLLPLEWSVRGLLSFSPQLNALAQRLYIGE